MISFIARPIIDLRLAIKLAPAAAGCISYMVDAPAGVLEGWPKFPPSLLLSLIISL
jgi:hypothetical protein